jgi:hypothetical protein
MSDNSSALPFYEAFINYLFSSGDITVPGDYHQRCNVVNKMLDSDTTGIVGTLVDYSINSASEAKLKIECSDQTLEDLLDAWLGKVNLNLNGVPIGLQELSKEYYKERWAGSSFCLMTVMDWEMITIGNNSIQVPTTLYFVNGSSIYVKRPDEKNYKLGTDEYYLDDSFKKSAQGTKKEIVIQKPFARWFDEYPSPYLIKKGVYKNWLAIDVLASKGDEVISKVLPYLFVIKKGNEAQTQKNVTYDDKDMKSLVDSMKDVVEKYQNSKGKIPFNAVPYDQEYSHLIPDLKNILTEELYRQGYRAMLAGLGFVDVIQGISSTRKESVLNPKPFVAEVNAGVSGFKSMLLNVINLIAEKNKESHRKLFSENKELKIVNSPLKINIEGIMDSIRSGFVYGPVSNQSYVESLGLDFDQEKERAEKEWKDGTREIMYPHLISNNEDKGLDTDREEKPAITKKELEKQLEKTKKPTHMQKSNLDEMLIMAPYTKENHPKYLDKYPSDAVDVWITVFNESLPKGEDYAFPAAWSVMKKYLKRHYIKNDDGTYTKKGQSSE